MPTLVTELYCIAGLFTGENFHEYCISLAIDKNFTCENSRWTVDSHMNATAMQFVCHDKILNQQCRATCSGSTHDGTPSS